MDWGSERYVQATGEVALFPALSQRLNTVNAQENWPLLNFEGDSFTRQSLGCRRFPMHGIYGKQRMRSWPPRKSEKMPSVINHGVLESEKMGGGLSGMYRLPER